METHDVSTDLENTAANGPSGMAEAANHPGQTAPNVGDNVSGSNLKTVPRSPDISPYEILHIHDPQKLQAHLIKRAEMLLGAGEKLQNVENHLLLRNSELGDPRLDPQVVKNLAADVSFRVKKTESGSSGSRAQILSAEEWTKLDLKASEQDVIVGTPENPIIRPRTKNFIEAPEKAFKTTAVMRLAMGIAMGQTVFPALPTERPFKVLYLHGELSPAEIKVRTISAVQDLGAPEKFLQGRDLNAHLIMEEGQQAFRDLIDKHRPEVVVIDPWQSFIPGFDENSFKDISTATHFLDTLIDEFGVTLLIPIHQGKNHKKGARGHSSLAGWRDTRIKLAPIPSNLAVRVTVEPRWARPPEPFLLKFKNGTVWPDSAPAWTGQPGKIRQLVQSNGGHHTKAAIGELLKLDGDALRKALKRAEAAGAIEINGEDVKVRSVQ